MARRAPVPAAKKLKAWLKKTGTSQAALARALDVSKPFVSDVLNTGGRRFGEQLWPLVEAFTRGHVRADEWLTAEERRERKEREERLAEIKATGTQG